MTKQAELLPAWMHPQNDQLPAYGDGEQFRPNGEQWLDPADDNAIYIANGHGYFEGLNGKCVREHPGHTLNIIVPEPHSDEYARYLSLDLHCWVVSSDEIGTDWLKNELNLRGVKFGICRIGLKSSKGARYEVMSVIGLTSEIYSEIDAIVQGVQARQQEQNAQWSKEQREKFKGIHSQIPEQEQKSDMTNKRDLVQEWQGAFELARKHAISDDKVHALWKQTAFSGEEPSLTEQNMDLLYKFIRNEIEVQEAYENARNVAANITSNAEVPLTNNDQPIVQSHNQDISESTENQVTAKEQEVVEQKPPEDSQTQNEEIQEIEIDEIDGYKINKKTGEIIDIDPNVIQEIIGPVPQEMRQGDAFVIQDEYSARWLIKRIRNKQRQIEEAERELKEFKNQVEVLKKRKLNEINGIRFVYGMQLAQWAKSQLPIIKSGDKKGQFRTKSLVFTEGTFKFKETGGVKCLDKEEFDNWWINLPESEKQMYPHKVAYSMLLSHVASCLNNGIEIPGFVNEGTDPIGDWDITVSIPRKPKRNQKNNHSIEETEETEEQESDAEEEAA